MNKGNIIVGQSGGPTAVINASLAGVFLGTRPLILGEVPPMMRDGLPCHLLRKR